MELHLYHIVAASGDAMVIGKENQLPWPKNSEDLKFFKETTMGGTVIMGRKTFESIGQRPLPGRENIVLSRSSFGYGGLDEVKIFHSVEEAIENASRSNVFIIGGAEIYRQTIDKAEKIYLTRIPGNYSGDVKYPAIPPVFKENKEESESLQKKFGIPVVCLENTSVAVKHS